MQPATRNNRCETCRMRKDLCLCAHLPRLALRTQVILLMHVGERDKPSNTGRLAHLCLPNSEIRYRGERDGTPLRLDGLVTESFETWMLHLSPQSEALTPALVARTEKPVRLLVPDGTWSQASRLGSQLARQLPAVKHVMLSASRRPSEYKLRSEHHPDGMATFEAIARALGVLEGAHVQEPMEEIFRRMNDRVLYTRGKLAAAEVRGGLR